MKDLLRFLTCGSVDDGKSTLIGHLLYDAKLLFSDQKQQLELESKAAGIDGIDYSLLLDGLMAEREQGITIDVAYRFFATKERSFIVADAPGHEEYTRNMAVGAAFADAAVILIDARKGVLTQTKRHLRICSMMGIRTFLFAVNKMDLVDYSMDVFRQIQGSIEGIVSGYETDAVYILPVSAKEGDNVITRSGHMPWYQGNSLLELLNDIEIKETAKDDSFILPVQRMCRDRAGARGYQGNIVSGEVGINDTLTVYPSKEQASVSRICVLNAEKTSAQAGQAVTVFLNKELDVSRGCVFSKNTEISTDETFQAQILWFDNDELVLHNSYYLKLGTTVIPVTVEQFEYCIDINNGEKLYNKDSIKKNEIAVCRILTGQKLPHMLFHDNPAMGRFILIDRLSNQTCACGIITDCLKNTQNLFGYHSDISREIRSSQKHQKPLTIWFTGLSGSGKSDLANELEKKLVSIGKHTMLLDGDNTRLGINKDLGFSPGDRSENIRRVSEIAKLMNDAGLIVLTAFISPYHADRQAARSVIGESFIEVYVSTPLEVCEQRDVKGLYKKAREGKISDFTGVSSEYEIPRHAEIVLDASVGTAEENAGKLLELLERYL